MDRPFAEEFRTTISDLTTRLDEDRRNREELERKVNNLTVRPGNLAVPGTGPGSNTPLDLPPPQLIEAKSGRPVAALSHRMRMADLPQFRDKARELPALNVGRMLRGLVLGGRADDARQLEEERKSLGIVPDPAGGYTVGSALSAQWIDLLRAQLILSQAGVTTIPMDTKTLQIAKLTGDVSASWHGENAALSSSDPTFGAANLNARTVVALVRFSLELAQDSSNIETMLQQSLTQALAHAIDNAGLAGATTDAGATPTGLYNLVGRGTVTGIGAPTNWDFMVDGCYNLLLANVPLDSIGAFVSHPRLWMKLRKLKTGITGDQTPLTAPPEIARLPKLFTTANPITGTTTTKGVMGMWSDYLWGVRESIQVKILDQAYMASNLQFAMLAFARCDFAAARPASFVTLEGITVT